MSGSGLISILFTDLVGSTELTSDIGDAAADSLRRAHFTELREALAATGGTEVKTDPYLAWTHHDWARAVLAQGRDGEPREHAEAAVAIAEEVGMSGPDGPLPFARKVLGS